MQLVALCWSTRAEQGRMQTQRSRQCSEFVFYTLKNSGLNTKSSGVGRQWWEPGEENDGGRFLVTKGNLVRLMVE